MTIGVDGASVDANVEVVARSLPGRGGVSLVVTKSLIYFTNQAVKNVFSKLCDIDFVNTSERNSYESAIVDEWRWLTEKRFNFVGAVFQYGYEGLEEDTVYTE